MIKRILSENRKGVRLKAIAYSIIVFACVVLFLTLSGIYQIDSKYHSVISATDQNIDAAKAINLMGYSSDYLTEQAREYVFTGEYGYAEAYFEEAENGAHIESSLNVLKSELFPDNQEIRDLLDEFVGLSREMMDAEVHAMKLAAIRNGVDSDSFPDKLAEFELTEEELSYSDQEKTNAAYGLIFGKDYMALRNEANAKMSIVQEKIESVTREQREDASEKMLHSIGKQRIYLIMIFVALISLLFVFVMLVLRPIYAIEESMKKQERLKEVGPRELRDLVKAYNYMCELNAESKVELTHEAEHDALTGLLNRGGFAKLTGYLQDSVDPTALILLDVDDFKSVNDTYGHQIGDEALKKVAELLKGSFRSNDYAARTGGDEFAVIMSNITPKEKGIIRSKITGINEVLSKEEGNIPKLSVSAGIAFSQIGYKSELYKMADEALYKTKEKGKCGYTFYGDWK